jgi:pimeloyl-ACP methyl ester carboxylesterase
LTAEFIIVADDASPGLPEILFRSDHIEVRRIAAGDGRHQVVTFESYHDDVGFGRSGFGESFFARAALTGIHVLTSGNDWYQYPEMEAALAVIRDAVSGADRVLTYGSSMGGYAAVRFADAVGATHVLSISPQYSIDPRRMRSDRRWWWEQKRIAFLPAYNGPITCAAEIVIAYDPTIKLDNLHARLIGRDVEARFLRLAYAGHPITTVLSELGILQTMALAMAAGPFDLAAVQADFDARREESSMWLAEYSSRLPGGDKHRARDLAARAATISPGNATVQHLHAMRLHELGRYPEAVEAHRRAVAIEPHPIFIISLSRSLFFAGQHAEAMEWMEQALTMRAFDDFYFYCAARIRLAMGHRTEAWRDALTAFRLAKRPRNIAALAYYGMRRITG